MSRYLAYISPLEDITNKEHVKCKVTFITGNLNHKTYEYMISTQFFNFYYYGSTIESIELDNNMQIVDIRDINEEDVKTFGLATKHVLTINERTYDMQADNGVTYNLRCNKMYNYCRQTVENILNEIKHVDKFSILILLIDGAAVYIQLDTDITKNTGYELVKGFVVQDKSKLKGLGKTQEVSKYHKNEKMKQKDIDKLLTELIK